MNTLLAATVLALSSAGLASAQTYHLTGSTAYRNAVISAEVQICGGSSAYAIYWGSTLAGANYSIVSSGTTTGSLAFENFWNGSIAGDQALTEPVSLGFPSFTAYTGSMTSATSGTVTATTLTNAGGGTAESSSASFTTDPHAPDIAMSDVFFSTAQQIMKAASPADTNTPSGGTSASNTEVGVVPFVFVADASPDVKAKLGTSGVAPATVSLSMDPQKFTYIWSSAGSAQLSLLTASSTDTATPIYPMGRDADSGTRSTSLAETGYGLSGSGILTTSVAQFYPYVSNADYESDEAAASADPTGVAGFHATTGVCGVDSGATTIEELDEVPFEAVDGYLMGSPGTDGDGGYYSGGNLAAGISTPFASSTANTVMLCYLGVSDAKTALTGTNPAVLLAYNGNVFYPTTTLPGTLTLAQNAAQIYYGKYTFWGYEHMYYLSSAASEASTLRTTLKTDLLDELSSNGVTLSGLQVSRSGDGENVQ